MIGSQASLKDTSWQ